METQNSHNQDKQSKLTGLIATVVFHGLILLLLYLTCFSSKPQELESGILVMVGVDEMGGGEELQAAEETHVEPEPQPEASQPSPATAPQPSPEPPAPKEPLLAQNDDNAPYIAEQKKKEQERLAEEKRRQQEEARRQAEIRRQQEEEARRIAEEEARRKAEEAERERKRQAAASMVAGALNNNGSGAQSGMQGSPDGNSNLGATSGHSGFGDYDVSGRKLMGSLPRPSFNSNESGKIVVNISVNGQGVVTQATIFTGTTISNQQLRQATIEAAKKARFNTVDGTSLVPGKITYYFDSNN